MRWHSGLHSHDRKTMRFSPHATEKMWFSLKYGEASRDSRGLLVMLDDGAAISISLCLPSNTLCACHLPSSGLTTH